MAISFQDFEKMAVDYTTAWNSGDPAAVVDHFAPGRGITINNGENQFGRDAMLAMAGGFMAAFPDLKLSCDFIRLAGTHAVYAWTLEGHHSETRNRVKVSGWEEWDLDDDCRIANSFGWFDAAEYERQVAGKEVR
jgi:hypothetical protein